MDIEFYDVKNKKKVSVPSSQVKKVTYERQTKSGDTQIRYALKAELNGVKLTKFVSKETWDQIEG
ncbi:MAG TPA: hypothetical protein PLS49_01150 [Candidatus Woesebacteria bacterium]|nr:hypothetical protein [Candidatus Woesebacteria bacterium]